MARNKYAERLTHTRNLYQGLAGEFLLRWMDKSGVDTVQLDEWTRYRHYTIPQWSHGEQRYSISPAGVTKQSSGKLVWDESKGTFQRGHPGRPHPRGSSSKNKEAAPQKKAAKKEQVVPSNEPIAHEDAAKDALSSGALFTVMEF
jgi:hypothetical protein